MYLTLFGGLLHAALPVAAATLFAMLWGGGKGGDVPEVIKGVGAYPARIGVVGVERGVAVQAAPDEIFVGRQCALGEDRACALRAGEHEKGMRGGRGHHRGLIGSGRQFLGGEDEHVVDLGSEGGIIAQRDLKSIDGLLFGLGINHGAVAIIDDAGDDLTAYL